MTEEERRKAHQVAHDYTLEMLASYCQGESYDSLSIERACIVKGYAAACADKQKEIDQLREDIARTYDAQNG